MAEFKPFEGERQELQQRGVTEAAAWLQSSRPGPNIQLQTPPISEMSSQALSKRVFGGAAWAAQFCFGKVQVAPNKHFISFAEELGGRVCIGKHFVIMQVARHCCL